MSTPEVETAATIPVVMPAETAPAVLEEQDPQKAAEPVSKRQAQLNDFVDEDTSLPELEEGDDEGQAEEQEPDLSLLEGAAEEDGDADGDGDGALDAVGKADDEEDFTPAKVKICKKACLECQHLVPWAEKRYKQCHFSNGNEDCPAQGMQIQIMIPFSKIVPRFLAAHKANDTETLATLYASLAKRPDYVQTEINKKIKEAIAQSVS